MCASGRESYHQPRRGRAGVLSTVCCSLRAAIPKAANAHRNKDVQVAGLRIRSSRHEQTRQAVITYLRLPTGTAASSPQET